LPYKPKEIKKLYYSISEVADMFQVAPSLLRFWETEFETLKPKKNAKGVRQFSEVDIEELKVIYHLVKEKGFTISGAREKIKHEKKKSKDKWEAIEALQRVKAFLTELKKNI
jgi:DNA-binding transcriptional MerR regulator